MDDALKAVEKAAAARIRAQAKLDAAEHAEDIAIQDAYTALGPGYGNVTHIAKAVQRSREHVRKVVAPKNRRGHYATASDDD